MPGCGKKHSRFIHVDQDVKCVQNEIVTGHEVVNGNIGLNVCKAKSDVEVHMPAVQVNVKGQYITHALLDTGSTHSFCSKSLVDLLNIKGSTVDYQLSTLDQSHVHKKSQIVSLVLESVDGSEVLPLSRVYVVDKIPIKLTPLQFNHYPHLQGIPGGVSDAGVDILIGQDNAEALFPIEMRRGKKGEPFAIRTLLGWCINGPANLASQVSQNVIANFVMTRTVEEDVNTLWRIDEEGYKDRFSWSQEDKKVIELWDRECRLIDGHYELPIPWKDPDVRIPNNLVVAMSRLQTLKKNLIKKDLTERYNAGIAVLLEKRYAEEVPQCEIYLSDRVWYLPHHSVITEKKPGKLRIVFDCASKYLGESLNQKCLQGPDLNNKLLHVLLQFREHEYAVTADIEAMYHQVKIPSRDRNALRFLWYDEDGQIKHYRMTSHLFGGIWCASSSTYALRRTVLDDQDVKPEIENTVMQSFYVDDCLKSMKTKNEACTVLQGTVDQLRRGGFRLTKFVANDEEILSQVPMQDRANGMKELIPEAESKVLGIKWNITSDEFCFDIRESECGDTKITRRFMLSFISSMYDPLGLVSPIIVVGKLIFQDATRLRLSWDEEVPTSLVVRWKAWLQTLLHLRYVRVPRCIKPREFNDAAIELHHFSDASEKAYGCCSYIRCTNKDGRIHTSLILSKNKVAPIKQMTIPRLELQAAVMSSRMDKVLRNELGLQISHSYFWTDSEIVLRYIKNETKRFHVYVGNRVSVIQELTKPYQWDHISGQENPADISSRGLTAQQVTETRWFQGPEFLQKYKSEWNMQRFEYDLPTNDPEVKGEKKHSIITTDIQNDPNCVEIKTLMTAHNRSEGILKVEEAGMENPMDILVCHFSSWYRLKRAVSWLLRLKDILIKKEYLDHSKRLTVSDMKRAELTIIKFAQDLHYQKEIDRLKNGKHVNKSSSIRKLSPIINSDGMLQVGGRLKYADIEEGGKNPYIIPPMHPVASLIVKEFHDISHSGTEWVLSMIRRKFWIVRGRSLIKKIARNCLTFKKLFESPCQQMMADLPLERCQSNRAPFTYVGLDCFGSFLVRVGRAEAKRYGCVYTCLSTRAVHIEKLNSMDTDTFLNGFIRFTSRRGWPEKVWSDNGTNFTGGHTELQKSLKQLDQDKIQTFGIKRNIEWVFNPPRASHMGGIWERMIRSIRKILAVLLNQNCTLTDDILETLFCQVESILNSRPLTKVSDDVSDLAALTPNHLLLLREGATLPLGKFTSGDMYRRRWRYVQYLADPFWRKWTKEYLAELQRRNKWTMKAGIFV